MATEAAQRPARLLYLDDDESMLLLMTTLLSRAGFSVVGTDDSRQALAAVRDEPTGFDVVIADHNLPGRAGLEVARELRSFNSELAVVLVSGYVDERLRTDAAKAGIPLVLEKPHTAVELTEMIVDFAAERGIRPGGAGA